jgi:2-polyprenyl-6-methoxyphenol hydroxylase-like FAD-dependent oxidoreductase
MSEVVIAGAGPNGLMLACELALAGVRSTVLDELPGPGDEPKANGLVGQVVRLLDMRGLHHAFGGGDGGPPPMHQWTYAGIPLDLSGIVDNPMRGLMIQQPRLVRLLEKRARDLGVDVRWGHSFAGVLDTPEGVTISVDSPGRDYRLDARYLVGADGGRSAVRKAVGIGFPGSTSNTVTRLAHVYLPDELRVEDGSYVVPGYGPLRFGHNRVERGGYILFTVQPERPMFATIEPGRLSADAPPMSIDDLRESATRVLGVELPIEPPRGPGPHALRRIDGWNTRLAEHYRSGHVLLLGDAAHVHSPMGGPGLNLGLQDSVNLGWKLAAEVRDRAPAGLLDSYESERRPVGERVMMQSLSQLALMEPGPETTALRTLFGELLELPAARAHLAHLLAGSDVRYDVGDAHPLSGRLVPDLRLEDGRRVADLLHDARPVLLDLSGGAFTAVATGWVDRVEMVVGHLDHSPAAAILLRPDGYVAWAAARTGRDDEDRLRTALARWFGPDR